MIRMNQKNGEKKYEYKNQKRKLEKNRNRCIIRNQFIFDHDVGFRGEQTSSA